MRDQTATRRARVARFWWDEIARPPTSQALFLPTLLVGFLAAYPSVGAVPGAVSPTNA